MTLKNLPGLCDHLDNKYKLVCLDNITIELMFLGINMFMAQLMSYEEGQKRICFQEHQLYYTIITIIKA